MLRLFTALSKALTDQVIVFLYRLCTSARRTCCTNSVAVMWCQYWKIPFNSQQVVKESACIWIDMPSIAPLCCGVIYVQEKKREMAFFNGKKQLSYYKEI